MAPVALEKFAESMEVLVESSQLAHTRGFIEWEVFLGAIETLTHFCGDVGADGGQGLRSGACPCALAALSAVHLEQLALDQGRHLVAWLLVGLLIQRSS